MVKSAERKLVKEMVGGWKPSALMTDGYKFSMAQAGFPLRQETFYYTQRRGGPFYIPFDLEEVVRHLLPLMPTGKEQAFLKANGYEMSPAMEDALHQDVTVWAAPKGSWVLAREPILTITGPSFLVSWLEPLVIMLNYPIQVATAFMKGPHSNFPTTCQAEHNITQITLAETATLSGGDLDGCGIPIQTSQYVDGVKKNLAELKDALRGDLERAFEVGMRGATCMEQHRLALKACREAGLLKTSNVHLAWELYMIPVGTTGHEHQQRWGCDEAAFAAVRDMRPEPPSYLFDTYDPINIGIPAALDAMHAAGSRPCSMRFDSGDQDAQFTRIVMGIRENRKDTGLYDWHLLRLIFEDGYTAEKTRTNEAFCEKWGWPKPQTLYGYGGYLVTNPSPSPFGRDKVSAAFKLTQTGETPRMKFSGTPGKESVPGKPVILRRIRQVFTGTLRETPPKGLADAYSVIAQEGENIPAFRPIDPMDEQQYTMIQAEEAMGTTPTSFLSPKTKELTTALMAERELMREEADANS